MEYDEQEDNNNRKKHNKYKKHNKDNQVSKIDKIKKYYADMNTKPEKVSEYVKRKTVEILSMSDKSRYEIEEKIHKNIRKDLHKKLVSDILDYFEELDYINDERFVENYIRIKYNSGFGEKRIEQELKSKKVDMFVFEEHIEKYDFKESLREYKERKYPEIKESTMKEMNKIYQKLVTRGFEYSKVKDAFSDVVILKEAEKEKKTKIIDNIKFLDKMTKKGYGLNKIKQEARMKGIEINDTDLENYDFYEIANEYKVKKYGEEKEKDPKIRMKKTNHMLGRGFSFDEIKECL